jgi:hypothetical protein
MGDVGVASEGEAMGELGRREATVVTLAEEGLVETAAERTRVVPAR